MGKKNPVKVAEPVDATDVALLESNLIWLDQRNAAMQSALVTALADEDTIVLSRHGSGGESYGSTVPYDALAKIAWRLYEHSEVGGSPTTAYVYAAFFLNHEWAAGGTIMPKGKYFWHVALSVLVKYVKED